MMGILSKKSESLRMATKGQLMKLAMIENDCAISDGGNKNIRGKTIG